MPLDGSSFLVPLLFSQLVIVLIALLHLWFRVRGPREPGKNGNGKRPGQEKPRREKRDDRP